MKINSKVLNKIIAIIGIFMMTVGNIAPIGEYAISRAIDMTGMVEAEESSNIKISAYFGKEENGEKIKSKEININSKEAKLYVDIAVLNEGYFNGEINLENSNFKISQVKESLYVKESTVKTHLLNIYNKAGCSSKAELIMLIMRAKIVA